MKTLKIAFVTEDNQRISSHFGMAPFYQVMQVEAGKVTGAETRAKPHHEQHPDHAHGTEHSHADMFAPIADCQILVVGGMGSPAHQKALAVGLEVILAGGEIQAALREYLAGTLASDGQRVHAH